MKWNRVERNRLSWNSYNILFWIYWKKTILIHIVNLINFSLFLLFINYCRLGPCELPHSDQWLSHTSASHLSQQTISSALLSPRAVSNNNNLSTNNNNTTNNNNNFNIQQQVSRWSWLIHIDCIVRTFWINVKLIIFNADTSATNAEQSTNQSEYIESDENNERGCIGSGLSTS